MRSGKVRLRIWKGVKSWAVIGDLSRDGVEGEPDSNSRYAVRRRNPAANPMSYCAHKNRSTDTHRPENNENCARSNRAAGGIRLQRIRGHDRRPHLRQY